MTMHQGLPLVLDHHNRSKGAAPLTPKQEPDTASPLAGVTGVSAYIISLSDHLASDSDMQALVVILAYSLNGLSDSLRRAHRTTS